MNLLSRSFVQKAIRSSKRRFINEKLNSQQNTKQQWDLVKQKTYKQSGSVPEYVVFKAIRLNSEQQQSAKQNTYVNSVSGGPAAGADPVTIADTSSEVSHDTILLPLSIGEIKLMMEKLSNSKAAAREDFPTWLSQ